MAGLKTQPTSDSVDAFLNAIPDKQRRSDCFRLLEIMKKATGIEPEMWGSSIVGFGRYKYKSGSGSGHESEWFKTGFSPRKLDLTLYIMPGIERHKDLLKKLGKHKTGRACLYIKRLEDVDLQTLDQLIKRSLDWFA
jgi:hypothetical protein